MGGNALGFEARRVTTDEMIGIVFEMQEMFPELKPLPVQSFRLKEDHGDIDLVVVAPSNDYVREMIIDRLAPTAMYPNKQFISFDLRGAQVDFIVSQTELEQSLHLDYMAWNDLGNFIGRVARSIGFKYGHDGLSYVLRINDTITEQLIVSQDIDKILTFLGYDAARWRAGFDTREEIFQYATETEYFNAQYFSLDDQSHQDRTRNRKRKMYQGFLAFLEEKGIQPRPKMMAEEWAIHVMRANKLFGINLWGMIAERTKHYEELEKLKRKFNGDLVAAWTGLSGKALGAFMSDFRDHGAVKASASWDEYIRTHSVEEIETQVKGYQKWIDLK